MGAEDSADRSGSVARDASTGPAEGNASRRRIDICVTAITARASRGRTSRHQARLGAAWRQRRGDDAVAAALLGVEQRAIGGAEQVLVDGTRVRDDAGDADALDAAKFKRA